MAKQLKSKINLSFTADTSQAKSQLKSLQDQLSKLSSANNLKLDSSKLTSDLERASNTAMQLQAYLQES